LAKKQKKATPERVPTKHQLSKWQRQVKMRRIVIIVAVVFLAGIASWVGYESYTDYKARVGPLHEVAIKVNDVPFTMEYFVKVLGIYVDNYIDVSVNTYVDFYVQAYPNSTREEIINWLTSSAISNLANNADNITDDITDMVAGNITEAELLKQGAKKLGIEVTPEEIAERLKAYGLPNDRVYRDIVSAVLLQEKLEEHFDSQLPDTMEQAHVQVMLVESQEVADEVITKVEAGGNFTALVTEFSCNSSIGGDLGWLPRELMPSTLIADAAFNITPGEISQSIYDETVTKGVGYWLIEVTDKQGNKIKARAMLLGSEVEAEWVRTELISGNFSSLAKEYSQHKSKDEGGELGWLEQGDMDSNAFDKVAFNTTVNEVSEPVKDESVQTTGGYWLVKVVDRGGHELVEKVKEGLIGKNLNDWFEEWKENSTIENLLDEEKKSWAVDRVLQGR
jgi:parvulin-like peptidyl-prolyl isomerase